MKEVYTCVASAYLGCSSSLLISSISTKPNYKSLEAIGIGCSPSVVISSFSSIKRVCKSLLLVGTGKASLAMSSASSTNEV
jgi:hypothetical protein